MPTGKDPVFKTTQRLQRAYEQGIRQIVRRVLTPILPEESLTDWLNRLADRTKHADVQEASELLSRRMTSWLAVKSAKTWREAAAKSQRSQELYRLLQREMVSGLGVRVNNLVAANAQYISSVSLEAASHLVHEVRKAQQQGSRPATVAKMMRSRFPELLRSRVHLISRTETAKASLALTEARCQELDIKCAEWLTSDDARVRASHKKMSGVIFAWDDLPDPETLVGEKSVGHYGPGGIFNCRCTTAPLLDPNYVTWPRKVYRHGAIHQMTKPQFLAAFT